MKFFLFFVFIASAYCDGSEFWCQKFDTNLKSLEQYCKTYTGSVPEDCAEEIPSVDADEVAQLRIGGCEPNIVSDAIKTFENIHILDISYSEYDSLDWLDLRLFKLEIFNASYNEIANIPGWFFKNAPRVTEVDLSHNRLTSIDGDAFQRVRKLKKINLSNNALSTSEPESFGIATNLEYIDLSQNRLWAMPILTKNKKLTEIHVEENPIRNFSCSHIEMMAAVPVHLSWRNVKTFSGDQGCQERRLHVVRDSDYEGILTKTDGTYEIHCSEQSFEILTNFTAGRNAFENVTEIIPCFGRSIETIDLSDNVVDELSSTVFADFDNLNRIALSNTNLTEFDFDLLSNQIEINELDISHNHLKRLENLSRLDNHGFEKLQVFNVAGNQLENIPEIIQYLKPALKKMDLSGNHVGLLNATTLLQLSALERLNLSNTSLSIDSNPFEQLTHLSSLDVSYNNLENIDVTTLSSTLRGLSEFRAANCYIPNASVVIENLGALNKKLDLSGNLVGDLKAATFEQFLYLKHLNLSNANITSIDNDALQFQGNLQILDLSNNSLQEIDLGAIQDKLEVLHLEGNNLTKIDNLTKSHFPSLQIVAISNNQLSCDDLKMNLKHEWKILNFIDDPYQQKHGEDCFLNYKINAIVIGLVLAIGAAAAIISVFGPIVVGLFT